VASGATIQGLHLSRASTDYNCLEIWLTSVLNSFVDTTPGGRRRDDGGAIYINEWRGTESAATDEGNILN
jgi:hypothetical protein